ncbi:MAG: GlsB/YeaQ/YmgE family stress response membrane protein [Bryobacteraceae bacterium]
MHLLWTLLIGLIVGAVAKLLTPGRDPGGFFITICIGIVGSLIATFLGRALGWYSADASAGFIASLFGAILLLVLYHAVVKQRAV